MFNSHTNLKQLEKLFSIPKLFQHAIGIYNSELGNSSKQYIELITTTEKLGEEDVCYSYINIVDNGFQVDTTSWPVYKGVSYFAELLYNMSPNGYKKLIQAIKKTQMPITWILECPELVTKAEYKAAFEICCKEITLPESQKTKYLPA